MISLISLMIGGTNAIDIHLSGEGGFVDCNGANTIFGENPRHVYEVGWNFGSVFCLASVHANVYCRNIRKFRKAICEPDS